MIDTSRLEQAAIDEFFRKEGDRLSDATTLEAPQKSSEFLRNRIWKAFTAGVVAGRSIYREEIKEKFRCWLP